MRFLNKKKYVIAVLLGLALGIALMAGGMFTYSMIYPKNSASAGIENSSAPSESASLPNNISDIVEKVSDAVVYIETTVESKSSSDPFFDDPFFRYFFGDTFNQQPRTRVSRGIGTGFIINKEGYIITNEHVISGAKEIDVTVKGFEKPFKATLVGKDFDLDLAVLKLIHLKTYLIFLWVIQTR